MPVLGGRSMFGAGCQLLPCYVISARGGPLWVQYGPLEKDLFLSSKLPVCLRHLLVKWLTFCGGCGYFLFKQMLFKQYIYIPWMLAIIFVACVHEIVLRFLFYLKIVFEPWGTLASTLCSSWQKVLLNKIEKLWLSLISIVEFLNYEIIAVCIEKYFLQNNLNNAFRLYPNKVSWLIFPYITFQKEESGPWKSHL